jgi:hypothetical protein
MSNRYLASLRVACVRCDESHSSMMAARLLIGVESAVPAGYWRPSRRYLDGLWDAETC